MIIYDRLWKTLKAKGITQYKLINEYQISPGQLTRLHRNESVTTHTLDQLCNILECDITDILEYISPKKK